MRVRPAVALLALRGVQRPPQVPDMLTGVLVVYDLGGLRVVVSRQVPDPLRPIADHHRLGGLLYPAPRRRRIRALAEQLRRLLRRLVVAMLALI